MRRVHALEPQSAFLLLLAQQDITSNRARQGWCRWTQVSS